MPTHEPTPEQNAPHAPQPEIGPNDDFDLSQLPSRPTNLTRGLTPTLVSLATILVEQELWCIGGDIRVHKNIPLTYGFERARPGEHPGSSAYHLVEGDTELVLWGWGIAYSEQDTGAIFIRRAEFDPLILASDTIPSVNHPSGIEPLIRPGYPRDPGAAYHLVANLCATLKQYEAWIAETYGEPFREARVTAHPNHDNGPYVPAASMARGWGLLENTFRGLAQLHETLPSDPWV